MAGVGGWGWGARMVEGIAHQEGGGGFGARDRPGESRHDVLVVGCRGHAYGVGGLSTGARRGCGAPLGCMFVSRCRVRLVGGGGGGRAESAVIINGGCEKKTKQKGAGVGGRALSRTRQRRGAGYGAGRGGGGRTPAGERASRARAKTDEEGGAK